MTTIFFSSLLANGRTLGPVPIGGAGTLGGFGPWSVAGNAAKNLATIVSNVLGFLTICGALWFIWQLIVGAYQFLDAGGEVEKFQKAKKRLSSAILGLTIVVAAYAITSLLGAILGLEFILDPVSVINLLTP